MRQIVYLKRQAEKAILNEVELQAKLHKMDFKKPPEPVGANKKQRNEYDDQALALLKKMKQRHAEHKVFNNGD